MSYMGRLQSPWAVKAIVCTFCIHYLITTGGQQFEEQYVGCFYDIIGSQSLTTIASIETDRLTIGSCIDRCRHTNKTTYAGLQNGTICSCRNDYGEQLPDSNCEVSCGGNSSQYCGGSGPGGQVSSYSLYAVCPIGNFGGICRRTCHCKGETACHRNSGICNSGCSYNWTGTSCNKTTTLIYEYEGCFLDKGNNRAFKRQIDNSSGNKRDWCIRECGTKYNDYYFIGLQYAVQCFCEDDGYNKHGLLSEDKCNMTCPGNANQKCGGSNANSIYRLVCPKGYFGPKCVNRCYCANEVTCSNSNGSCPINSSPLQSRCKPGWDGHACNQRDCSFKNGDCELDQICETINLGYTNTSVCRGALQNQYVGCFRGKMGDDNIKVAELPTINNLTIALCIKYCRKQEQKTFAALQNGKKCLCDDDFGDFLSDDNCQTICSGSQLQYCGGENSFSIYTVCPIGTFGAACEDVCHCKGPFPCNRKTGQCPDGCQRNWNGTSCNITTTHLPLQYVGCYQDGNNTSPKAMESYNPGGKTGKSKQNYNTVENCLEICRHVVNITGVENSYTYAGMQYHYDCNCGDTYDGYNKYQRLSEDRCNLNCSGRTSQNCGGNFANSVYSVCPIGTYGPNCGRKCNCANETSCINRNGTCQSGHCKPGWNGRRCDNKDKFELWCSNDTYCGGSNEICQYIELKYTKISRCRCQPGFNRKKPWDLCKDVDECHLNVTKCDPTTEDCNNTIGSYVCNCKHGLHRNASNDTCEGRA